MARAPSWLARRSSSMHFSAALSAREPCRRSVSFHPSWRHLVLVRSGRHQKVAPSFRYASRDSSFGIFDFGGSLVFLIHRQIEQVLFFKHFFPCLAFGKGMEQVFEVLLIRGEKDQSVLVLTGTIPLFFSALLAHCRPELKSTPLRWVYWAAITTKRVDFSSGTPLLSMCAAWTPANCPRFQFLW